LCIFFSALILSFLHLLTCVYTVCAISCVSFLSAGEMRCFL
jgi:hypothetical protein